MSMSDSVLNTERDNQANLGTIQNLKDCKSY